MKRILGLLLALIASPIFGQTSAVTATIQDQPDGQAWASLNGFNATYTITLVTSGGVPVPSGQAYRADTGATVTNPAGGNLDATGTFTATVVSNSNIKPAGTQWQFGFCSATIARNCYVVTMPINASGTYSTQLSAGAVSPRVNGGVGVYAYTDTEVATIPNNSYYNITTPATRCYGASWGSCGGGGGSGTVTSVSVTTANGVSGTVATATTTPAISLTLGAINPSSTGATTAGTGAFTTGTFSTSVSVGSSPPTACGSATGCLSFNDASTAGTPTAGMAYIRADSSSGNILASINASAESALDTAANTLTLSNKTLASPAITNSITQSDTTGSPLTSTTTGTSYPNWDYFCPDIPSGVGVNCAFVLGLSGATNNAFIMAFTNNGGSGSSSNWGYLGLEGGVQSLEVTPTGVVFPNAVTMPSTYKVGSNTITQPSSAGTLALTSQVSGTTVNYFSTGNPLNTHAANYSGVQSFGIFTVTNPVSFTHLYYYVTGADGGGTAREDIGVYSCPSNDCSAAAVTGTLVCDIGPTAMASGGTAASAACAQGGTIALSIGTYILGWTANNSAGQTFGGNTSLIPFSGGTFSATSTSGQLTSTVTTPSSGTYLANLPAIALH